VFQIRGVATGNARQPTVDRLVGQTVQPDDWWEKNVDRSVERERSAVLQRSRLTAVYTRQVGGDADQRTTVKVIK